MYIRTLTLVDGDIRYKSVSIPVQLGKKLSRKVVISELPGGIFIRNATREDLMKQLDEEMKER